MTQLVASPEELSRMIDALAGADRIAIDTESDGMHAYQGRLCVVQLAAARPDGPAEEAYILDTLALDATESLTRLTAQPNRAFIIHDLGNDVRMLRALGIELQHVIDTSIAARMLGIAATGLATLL